MDTLSPATSNSVGFPPLPRKRGLYSKLFELKTPLKEIFLLSLLRVKLIN